MEIQWLMGNLKVCLFIFYSQLLITVLLTVKWYQLYLRDIKTQKLRSQTLAEALKSKLGSCVYLVKRHPCEKQSLYITSQMGCSHLFLKSYTLVSSYVRTSISLPSTRLTVKLKLTDVLLPSHHLLSSTSAHLGVPSHCWSLWCVPLSYSSCQASPPWSGELIHRNWSQRRCSSPQ